MGRIRGVLALFAVACVAAALSGSGRADVALTLSIGVPSTVAQGTDFGTTFTVTNTGSTPATNVHLDISMPPSSTVSNLRLDSACGPGGPDGSVQCNTGALAAGASASVTITGHAEAIGTTQINADAVADGGATASANGGLIIVPPPSNISMGESISPNSIAPGGNGSVSVSVSNGGADKTSFWITLDLGPGAWSLSSASQTGGPAFSCSTSQYHMECSIGTFAAGASATFAVPLAVASNATPGQVLDSRVASFLNAPSGSSLAGASAAMQVAQPAGGGTTPPTTTTTTTPPPSPTTTTTVQVQTHALSITLDGNGAGSVASAPGSATCTSSCTESYTQGAVVTLTETPTSGSVFGGWNGACANAASSPTCSVTMSTEQSVTATFDRLPSTPPPSARRCHVPSLNGLTVAQARQKLSLHACALGSQRSVKSPHVPRGRIVGQTPKAGAVLAQSGRVTVTVSKGR